MELKFLLLSIIPLLAVFGSTEANPVYGGQPRYIGSNNTYTVGSRHLPPPSRYGGRNSTYIPFRQPGTTSPPIYTASSYGGSNSSVNRSAPPPRWSGPYPTPVGHGQHGHNEHRYPSYNGSVGITPTHRPNVNQYGNRNNPTSLYPSLEGLGNDGNQYRPPTQGPRPNFPYPMHNGQPNYQSGGNQYRPAAPGGAGTWNGTSSTNSPQPHYNGHPNYQNAYGNEYRPTAVQGAAGNGAWNNTAGTNNRYQPYNGQQNFQGGLAHYNRTDGRQPVHSGY